MRDTTGSDNTAVGYDAMYQTTSGGYNTAVGHRSMQNNTTGQKNVSVGTGSMDDNTTGVQMTSVGAYACSSSTTANSNTGIGFYALKNATGGNNTAVGEQAGVDVTSGTNNLCLGLDAGRSSSPSGSVTTSSNIVVLGNNSITDAYIKVAFTTGSDKRDKTDIENFNFGLDWVNKMRPVTYRWDNRDWYEDGTSDGSKKASKLELGLIAQEELEIEKEFGYADNDENMLITSINSNGSYVMKYERIVFLCANRSF